MEAKTRKWLHVALFSIVIFLTLPAGPHIRDFLYDNFGTWFILYTVVTILGGGFLWALILTFHTKTRFYFSQLLWFAIIVYLYWFALKRTFKVPIESVHFVEYGILSLLVFRALRESYNERQILFTSFLITFSLGILDEFIQWLIPNRVGSMRDIVFNGVSGGLVQLLLWKGVRLEGLLKGFPARSFRISSLFVICNLIATGAFISLVSDFGYRIRDPEVGTFFSRMTKEEILRRDTEMNQYYGEAIDSAYTVSYSTFLEQTEDPFLYEMRVRLFRRDRHFEDESYAVSCCEQEILDKYFKNTQKNSLFALTEEKTDLCAQLNRDCSKYRSPVSRELIVRFEEKEMWFLIGLLSTIFLFLGTRRSLTSSIDEP